MMTRIDDCPPAFRRVLTAAMAIAVAAGAACPVAARTAKDEYDVASECAALTQAGIPIPGQPADKIKVLVPYFVKQAASTGKLAGMTQRQVDADVASTRTRITREWAAGKPGNHAYLSKLAGACAALPFFEAVASAKHGK